jgi:hypothetical protein
MRFYLALFFLVLASHAYSDDALTIATGKK